MSRSQQLAVLLKAIGFWSLAGALSTLPQSVSFWHRFNDEQTLLLMFADTFAAPVVLIAASWFLIRSSDWFVRTAGLPSSATACENDDASARQLLGVILKALGCWEILHGIARAPYELAALFRASATPYDRIASEGIVFVVGCFLVFATDACLGFAYRKPVEASDDELSDDARNPAEGGG